jgi:hypothetical protein
MYELKNEEKTLRAVQEMLREMGEEHVKDGHMFNMQVPAINYPHEVTRYLGSRSYKCGTVACIGGSAYLYENPEMFADAAEYVSNANGRLHQLYFPEYLADMDYDEITPAQAVIAIDRYLDPSIPDEAIWSFLNDE